MVDEYFGNGKIKESREIFDDLDVERVFLVHGESSFSLSGVEEKVERIKDELGLEIVEFTDFSSNPKVEEVKEGVSLFDEKDNDIVMAVGGGSSIDVAKMINLFSVQKSEPEEYILGRKDIENGGLPLLAVPTTAGTGSEATHFAVVYVDGEKYSVAHDSILPDYVILDPELTLTLPEYQTACTGMDALCQAIESYWSVNSTSKSKEYAKKAIDMILDNIVRVVENTDDLEAREEMLRGANFSGKAINISKTTAAHACSYVITSKCGIPHGHAVAIMMKEYLRYNGTNFDKVVDERGVDYLRKTMDELYLILDCSGSQEASKFFERLMGNVGLEAYLGDICKDLTEEEFLEGVNVNRLSNNPISLEKKELKNIFRRIQTNE